jgi:outer membrane protein
MLKRLLSIVSGLMLASLIPAFASADLKVGFVNMAVILEKAPQADAARKDLEREFSTREANLAAERAAIKEMKEQLATDGEIMSSSKRESLTYKVRKREREYVRAMDDLKDDFNLRYNELRDKLQNDISKVIVDLAKNEKYDLMVREGVTGVLYASERIDITDKILTRLKRSYKRR